MKNSKNSILGAVPHWLNSTAKGPGVNDSSQMKRGLPTLFF